MQTSPRIIWEDFGSPGSLYTISAKKPVLRNGSDTLYLFLDESGDFNFSDASKPLFFMTCVAVRRPFLISSELESLRLDLIERGIDVEYFHACNDNKHVRKQAYELIGAHLGEFSAYCINVVKGDVPEELREPNRLYSQMFEWIIDEVLCREIGEDTSRIVIITDRLSSSVKRKQIVHPLKRHLGEQLKGTGIVYDLFHHASCSISFLQVADYVSWAVQRSMLASEDDPLDAIRGAIVRTGIVKYPEKGQSRPNERP